MGSLAKTRTVQAEELAKCDHPGCSAIASRDVYWGDHLQPGLTVEEIRMALIYTSPMPVKSILGIWSPRSPTRRIRSM